MRKHRSGSFLPCIEYVLGLGQISGHMIDGLSIAIKKKSASIHTSAESSISREETYEKRREK